MLKKTKMYLKIKKIAIPFTLLASLMVFIPIVSTSCSHIPNDYETTGNTTIPNESKTIIKLDNSDVVFTREYFWDNINYFKNKIISSQIFENIDLSSNEISIPYSCISAIDQGNKKSFTVLMYLQKFYYNGKLIELNNTAFNLGYDEHTYTISSSQFREFLSYDPDSEETFKKYQQFIINNIDQYFSSIPPSVTSDDLIVKQVNASSESITVTFELRSLYNLSGEKSKEFKLTFIQNQTQRNSFKLMSSTKNLSHSVSNNFNVTKIQFIID